MPYVKGMLHKVDFKDFYKMAGTTHLTDIWGVKHQVKDVDIILTKSMFKGIGWLNGSGKTWEDYWKAFRKYHHALYITQVGDDEAEATTRMNFQFLNTLNLTTEEFRPADLPLGWDHSPADDPRDWVTKETTKHSASNTISSGGSGGSLKKKQGIPIWRRFWKRIRCLSGRESFQSSWIPLRMALSAAMLWAN